MNPVPGNSAYNHLDDWTGPDPWIHQPQGIFIEHGPGPK